MVAPAVATHIGCFFCISPVKKIGYNRILVLKKIGDQISYDSKGFVCEQYFLVLTLHFL